jgi:hypothetical protein
MRRAQDRRGSAISHSRKVVRQQATARRQSRNRLRIIVYLGVPAVIAAIIALVILTKPPGYRGFEVIGQQPAIVQVFLPG